MNPNIATAICISGILGLFYLDREKADRTSFALWLPGLWIGIVLSRPMSQWFGVQGGGNLGLDGSPFDAAIFGVLELLALAVLVRRSRRTLTLLSANWPIAVYFIYCLISISWSSHPDVSFKRWIKAIGDVAMALIIATDVNPTAALRRVVTRIGIVLLPMSVLFIRYFGDIGRGYTIDGAPMNTGVTQNKNSLGLTLLLISLLVLWNFRWLITQKNELARRRQIVAQGMLLLVALALFWMANSSTSKACFLLGSALIFFLNRHAIRKQPGRVYGYTFAIVIAVVVFAIFGQDEIAAALGRDANLSGRTDIWEAIIPTVSNPLLGAGFESYWNSANVEIARRTLIEQGFSPLIVAGLQEAHNGYIEVYLQLGWVGILLIANLLISSLRRTCRAYQLNPDLGSLFITYVVVAIFYSMTEAGFRTMSPTIIFLLTVVISATEVIAHSKSVGIPISVRTRCSENVNSPAAKIDWQRS